MARKSGYYSDCPTRVYRKDCQFQDIQKIPIRTKRRKRADKEDWVVFDDTQEPIVDEETWLLAQKLRQNVRKADPMGELMF